MYSKATGYIKKFITSSKLTHLCLVIIFLISLFSLQNPIEVQASTGQVYYVSTNGSDSNSGTQASPWLTIQKAANTMAAGDTVNVMAGDYSSQRVQMTTSGSSGKPITFQAQGSVTMKGFTVKASYVDILGFYITNTDNNDTNGWGIFYEGSNCLISNNHVYYATRGGIILYTDPSNFTETANCVVSNNKLERNSQMGIEVHGRNNLIEYNEVWGSIQYHPSWVNPPSWVDADGMRFFGQGHIFRGNYIHDIDYGITENVNPHIDCFQTFTSDYVEAASNILFEQNNCQIPTYQALYEKASAFTIENGSNITIRNNILNAFLVVYVSDGSAITIENNLLEGQLSYPSSLNPGGILLGNSPDCTVLNNIFYNIPGYTLYAGDTSSQQGLNAGYSWVYWNNGQSASGNAYPNDTFNVNPKFVDPSSQDFHISSNSPLIDAGVVISGVTNDYDNAARPQPDNSKGIDTGPLEYVVTTTSSPTATNTSVPSATSTSTTAPIASATNTTVPSATVTKTQAPTVTATNTKVPTSTSTNTSAPTATTTKTLAPTTTSTNTTAPTATLTRVPAATVTSTIVPTATSSQIPTATHTAIPIATLTSTLEPSATPTLIPTIAQSNTSLPTATSISTQTSTVSFPTSTSIATNIVLQSTPTATVKSPSATSTLIPTSTSTPVPSATATHVPSSTSTRTSVPTNTRTARPSVTATSPKPTSTHTIPTPCFRCRLAHSSWPIAGYNYSRSAQSSSTGPTDPSIVWSYSVASNDSTSPILDTQNNLYLGSGSTMNAVSPTGSLLWSFQAGGTVTSPLLTDAGNLYFGSKDGNVYNLNASDGQVVWTYQTNGSILSAPGIDEDGTIYVPNSNGTLDALDPDGNLIWSYATNGSIQGSPAILSDNSIVFGTMDGNLFMVDNTGTLEWSYTMDGSITTAPAISPDNNILISSSEGTIYEFNPAGQLVWSYKTGSTLSSPAVDAQGNVYFGSSDNHVYALSNTGTLIWTYLLNGQAGSPVIGDDGTIYVGTQNGYLTALQSNGNLGWNLYLGGNSIINPIIGSDGYLYTTSGMILQSIGESNDLPVVTYPYHYFVPAVANTNM